MLKTTSFVIAILFSVTSFCQPEGKLLNHDIKAYHFYVNKAELAIVDSNYKDAYMYYTKAFEEAHKDGKDLYNAFMCAVLLKDTFAASRKLVFLALNGLRKEFVSYNLDSIKRGKLLAYMGDDYDGQRDRFFNSTDQLLPFRVGVLNALEKRYKSVRQKKSSWAEIRAVDSVNIIDLKKLVDSKGFPHFIMVGYFPDDTSPLEPDPTWYTILYSKSYSTMLDGVLRQEVIQNIYRPDLYATIFMVRNDDRYKLKLNPEALDKATWPAVNQNRSEIYLEPMEDYIKKLQYQINHPTPFCFYNKFILDANRSIWQKRH